QPTEMTKVKLRIMQPNLQQDVKFNYAAKAEVMQKYLALSDRASGPQSTGVRDVQILIWPESAFPFFLTREADAMAQIAELLTKVHGGFIPGTGRRTMEIPNAPRALPLICYEAIFPGNVAARDDRPGWIVNLTNDGWFGNSTGPYQHLQQARLRAIEEGLPMVRAANTGISAVIDPSGRIVARLGLGIEGVLD